MGEKVGSDVLGSESTLGHGGLTSEQRMKLKRKFEEQKRRRKAMGDRDDIEGKEIHDEGPNDQHEPKLGEGSDLDKPVKVREHKRGRPRKGVNAFFERQTEQIRE